MTESQFHSVTIASVSPETSLAVRLGFKIPAALAATFDFRQGQYLTLRSVIDGETVRRAYSICAAPGDGLEVGIKRVPGGVFSNFANDRLKIGDKIELLAPQGSFFTALAADHEKKYLFIAAGSGITPVISNIKAILQTEAASQVTLLLGNRRSATMMFRERLSFLKNRYMQRFHWINILSREDQGSDMLNGRLNNSKGGEINRCLVSLASFDDYFICGPESMISEVSRGLRSVGAREDNIHYELFASSAADARAVIDKHHARALAHGDKQSQVSVQVDGRAIEFQLASNGENILDASLNNGLDLPYSCKSGVCSTCKARLIAGEVDMDITHGLEASEIASGFILTCQAHPVSKQVVVDFDQK